MRYTYALVRQALNDDESPASLPEVVAATFSQKTFLEALKAIAADKSHDTTVGELARSILTPTANETTVANIFELVDMPAGIGGK